MKLKFISLAICTILFISLISAQTSLTLIKNETFDVMPNNYSTLERKAGHNLISDLEVSDKWIVKDSKLQVRDFSNKTSGALIFLFTDRVYSADENYTFSAVVDRKDYNSDWDSVGLIIGYNSTNKSYYYFSASDRQIWFYSKKIKPPFVTCHINSDCYDRAIIPSLNLAQERKMQINVNSNKVTLIINDVVISEINVRVQDGYIGFYIWDSTSGDGDYIDSESYFDDVLVYKQPVFTASQPENNTKVEQNTEQDFSITVKESNMPIKEAKVVIYNESTYIVEEVEGFPETITERTIVDEVSMDVIEKDEKIDISGSYVFKNVGVFKWFFIVIDWVDNLFKPEQDKTIIVTNQTNER